MDTGLLLLLLGMVALSMRQRHQSLQELFRKASWQRETALGRMSPEDRLQSVAKRFEDTMQLAAQRLGMLNFVTLSLHVWFLLETKTYPSRFDFGLAGATVVMLGWITRKYTYDGPAAEEARSYQLFVWGYRGRWLDIGFVVAVLGMGIIVLRLIFPLLLGMYLGAAVATIFMLIRWGNLGRAPWDPSNKVAAKK